MKLGNPTRTAGQAGRSGGRCIAALRAAVVSAAEVPIAMNGMVGEFDAKN
jgi:hypothetical protein